jgi:hypothetical protein
MLIDELVEAGLAQETADARFSLHQTVRRHAVACARAEDPEPDRVAMIRRATEHLLVRTAFADRAVLGAGCYRCTPHAELLAAHPDPFGGTNSRLRALTWLDAERATWRRVCVPAWTMAGTSWSGSWPSPRPPCT